MDNANQLNAAELERLSILVEELGESVKAVGKILRHGYESYNPLDPVQTNRRDLEMELGDVHAASSMMYTAKDISQSRVKKYCRRKLTKPNRNLHHQPDNIVNPPAMIVVAGSRNWNNYTDFCDRLEKAIKMLGVSNFVIVSGNASRGADAMAIKWAESNGVRWVPFTADWDNLGKRAGFVRNAEMAEVATHLIAFFDMNSNGTKNMIELALSKEIPTLVFKVQPDTINQE
jgi:NTP pyrophosphatase (non-canonical NTP hydrolase)